MPSPFDLICGGILYCNCDCASGMDRKNRKGETVAIVMGKTTDQSDSFINTFYYPSVIISADQLNEFTI
uniref:5'-nucleotidase n=1 Tax=Steinernema glaseri TaxID=37863 RepID=A0A1I8A851_9BILA